MTTLTLDLERSASGKQQSIVLHGNGMDRVSIEVETSQAIADPQTLDSALCYVLFYAMRHARTLKVNGPVSEKFLRNIRLFQEAWQCHHQDLYGAVEILSSSVVSNAHLSEPAVTSQHIQTFSGGVDSLFSLLRNSGENVAEYLKTNAIVLVQGFDIPCSNQRDFDNVRRRVENMADTVEVDMHVVKTNLRSKVKTNWEHSHGAALAGVLHQFSRSYGQGIIASSDPYNFVSFVPHAWGSSPATDYLLSGDEMEIIHDGAGFSRVEKIAYLANEAPALLSQSQFCWQGEVRSENCGVCDKCIHTRLALRAAGHKEDLCFTSEFSFGMIDNVKVGEETLGDILPLLNFAQANGCREPWVQELEGRTAAFLPVMYKTKGSAAKSLRYFRAALRELLPSRSR